jgi:hypothetical protein
MIIIGVDFHPEFQQISSVDTESGEFREKRLAHPAEAEQFYRALSGAKVRVGMEASGHARWFERLMAELQFELRIGDAAEIRTKRACASRRRIGRTHSQHGAVALRSHAISTSTPEYFRTFLCAQPIARAGVTKPIQFGREKRDAG